jgi:polyadenylate-binding protein
MNQLQRNIFIKQLPKDLDNQKFFEFVSNQTGGKIYSSKLAIDENFQSKGYGFIQFESD